MICKSKYFKENFLIKNFIDERFNMEPELEVKKAKKVELKLKNKYFRLHNTAIFYSSSYEYLCYSGKTKIGF